MKPIELENNLEEILQSFTNKVQHSLTSMNFISFNKTEITEAILFRMRSYYRQQEALKSILDKHKAAPAADFFVETITFYLKTYLSQHKPNFHVYSERPLKKKRRALHPDITIRNALVNIQDKNESYLNQTLLKSWRTKYISFISDHKTLKKVNNIADFMLNLLHWQGSFQSLILLDYLFFNVFVDNLLTQPEPYLVGLKENFIRQ